MSKIIEFYIICRACDYEGISRHNSCPKCQSFAIIIRGMGFPKYETKEAA